MASALSPPSTSSSSPKEKTNFARLSRLLINYGTKVLKEVFDNICPPSTLHTLLHSSTVHPTLQGLRRRRILNTQQWDRLYPRSTPVTSHSFDITLLFILLRNICSLTPPSTGWDNPPVASDTSTQADLARIKLYRNTLYGHITVTAMSDSNFEKYWGEISDLLVRLGGHYKNDIERLKVEVLDSEDETYFISMIRDWEQTEHQMLDELENVRESTTKNAEQVMDQLDKMEESTTKNAEQVMDQLDKMEESTTKNIGQVINRLDKIEESTTKNAEQVMDRLDKIESDKGADIANEGAGGNTHSTHAECTSDKENVPSSRAKEYTNKLKSSIKEQTDFLLTSHGEDKRIRTDEIFTNVTIERGQKHFQEEDRERSLARSQIDHFDVKSTTLKNCSEMFICPENDGQKSTATSTTNPRSILLSGKAGIGKSLFCRKLVRDWAEDRLFEKDVENTKLPDIQFALLLTFRQLSLLGHEQLDLRDILNRCTLLDKQSIIDEVILQDIIQNPEKLLIIFDGYDEYKYREEITGDFETKYPNDHCQKIPVPALIAKIMKGQILKESVVVVSSRPGEADALKAFNFDVRCEIKGFSSQQVIDYVDKYFQDSESTKKAVIIDHIKANEILLSFGQIPVMCFLMCYCIKWHITREKTVNNLPVTRTELYHEVIKLFLKKHSSSKYGEMKETELQAILYKLAELAVNLMKEGKYIFNENDMKRFKLTDEEINNLKASGLFDCCPAVKTSPSEKTKLEFMFTHLTLQEYLCAFWFVEEKKKIPKRKKTSDVTFMFMAGLLSRKKDEKLMKKLLKYIKPKGRKVDMNKVLRLQCLYEYRDDELSKRVIHNLHDKYCTSDGWIDFSRVSDIDCVGISYLIHIIGLLNEEQTKQHPTSTQSFIVESLIIISSMLSPSGVRMLCDSLVSISTLTRLWLWDCHLDDKCIEIICNSLMSCTITSLHLSDNNITDVGVTSICNSLMSCTITDLNLSRNNITGVGATSICEALIHNECHVRWLSLWGNDKITAECKKYVRELVGQHKPGVRLVLDVSDLYK